MNELIPFSSLDVIAQSINPYPVDFDDAWKWVGYSRKDVGLDALKANFEEPADFCSGLNRGKRKETTNLISHNKPENQVSSYGGRREGAGRKETRYYLTADCFKAFCMMAGTEKGKEVRRYFLDMEKRYKTLVESRKLSKLVRRDFTDVIQDSGLNTVMHGFAYKQFTDLINKAVLGMDARKYREINNLPKDANVREHITPVQMASIAKIEKLVGAAIEVGADYCKVKDMIADMGIGKIESRVSA